MSGVMGAVALPGPATHHSPGDNVADFAQYSLLRESADAKLLPPDAQVLQAAAAMEPAGRAGPATLQDACVRMSHLLQTSCLALRRLQLDVQDQRLAREALESQLAYMQACLRRSLASFDHSA
jgi:hypothetical protein